MFYLHSLQWNRNALYLYTQQLIHKNAACVTNTIIQLQISGNSREDSIYATQ